MTKAPQYRPNHRVHRGSKTARGHAADTHSAFDLPGNVGALTFLAGVVVALAYWIHHDFSHFSSPDLTTLLASVLIAPLMVGIIVALLSQMAR